METRDLIPIELVCEHYSIPAAFIITLQEFKLVELTLKKEVYFIHKSQIKEVEKIARLHYDLEINIEGIDVIYNLLDQVNALKKEIAKLNSRLQLYEDL